MHQGFLHSLIALFAASLLLLPYVPHLGRETHKHCIHCTGNYCTKERCDCGHAHAPAKARSSAARVVGHSFATEPGATVSHPEHGASRANYVGAASQRERGVAASHAEHGREASHAAHDAEAGPPAQSNREHAHSEASHPSRQDAPPIIETSVQPCGSSPPGMLLPSLDKFVPSGTNARLDEPTERPLHAGLLRLPHQTTADDVFRPPASRAQARGPNGPLY